MSIELDDINEKLKKECDFVQNLKRLAFMNQLDSERSGFDES